MGLEPKPPESESTFCLPPQENSRQSKGSAERQRIIAKCFHSQMLCYL
jgi:hypothetical protein